MKKLIITIMAVLVLSTPVTAMQYGPDYYMRNSSYHGTGYKDSDPISLFMQEVIDKFAVSETIDTGGMVYYVDNNAGNDDNNGKSWEKAFLKISTAMAASHADIALTNKGANRNRIYVKGDDFAEDWTKLARKTDIIGVGSDDGKKMPRILGQHTIEAQATNDYMGCRFINMMFRGNADDTTELFSIPSNQNGIEFIGCKFMAADSGQTVGILNTTAHDMKIIGCTFDRAAIGNEGFTTAAISIATGSVYYLAIVGNVIEANVGILINGSTIPTGGIITDNLITAATLTIDDNSNKYYIANNTLISDAAYGATSYDFDDTFAVNNVLTAAGDTYMVPVDTTLETISTNVTALGTSTNIGFRGDVTAGASGSVTSGDLSGFGADFFNTDWVVICTYNASSAGNAPEGQIRDITDYDSTSGIFTHTAFASEDAASGDKIMICRREWLTIDGVALLAAPAAGSLANYIAGTGSIGTDLGTGKSLVDVIGTDGAVLADDALSVVGIIGVPTDADHAVDSTNTAANDDGSLFERLEQIDVDTSKIETSTTTTIPGTITTAQNDLDIITGTNGAILDTDAITTAKVATGAIGADEVGTGAIDADSLAADAIVKIADGIVETESNGLTYYCDAGGSGGDGLTWATAKKTLGAAEALITDADCTIYVGQGHVEDIGAGVMLNIQGTRVIGIGIGDAKPMFTFDATASEITLGAANITLKNLRFRPGITVCTVGILCEEFSDGSVIEDCDFVDGQETTVDEFVDAILIDAVAHNITVKNCTYQNAGTDGHTSAFVDIGDGTAAGTKVIDCVATGNFAQGVVWSDAVNTDVLIKDNVLTNIKSSVAALVFSAAATGNITGNRLYSDAWATMLDPGNCYCNDNIGTISIDEAGIEIPISANSTTVAEEDDGSNLERLEYLQNKVEDILAGIRMSGGSVGDVYYCQAGGGDGDGTTWATAEVTLAAAIADCTANVGDIIFVAPAHSEALTGTTDITINTAGITIIGIGEGAEQPQIDHQAAATSIVVTAAGVHIKNMNFHSTTIATAIGIDLGAGAADFILEDCLISDSSTNFEFAIGLNIGAEAERTTVRNCKFISYDGNTGATSAIAITGGVVDRLIIEDCYIMGNFTDATIHSDQINTDMLIQNNVISNKNSGNHAIQLNATTTGMAIDNRIFTDAFATGITVADLYWIGNLYVDATDESGYPIPAVGDRTDNYIGTNSADNDAVTSAVLANGDGSSVERLEFLQTKSDAILAKLGATGVGVGDVYYVDSVTGDTADNGTTWALAEATISQGEADCTANKGDIVFVAPGHSETLGDATIAMDSAGVTVIGLGDGADMPCVDMQHGNSSLVVTAASVTIKGINFYSSTAVTDTSVDLSTGASDFTIEDCLFNETGGFEHVISINVGAEGENCTIRNCRLEGITGSTGSTSGIFIAGVVDRLIIEDCHIWGNYTNAGIYSTAINTNALIRNNSITNNNSGNHAIELTGATTGDLINNMLSGDTYGSVLDPGSMRCFGNMQTVGIDAGAEDIPLIAGKSYSRSMLDGDLNATQNLFDVDGGPILITFFVGHCTVDGDAATTRDIYLDSDDAAKDYDFSTAVDIQLVNQGDYIIFDETVGESILSIAAMTGSGSLGPAINWMCEEGLIICRNTATDGGAGNIEWYMRFTPLVSGVEVIPQAGN